MTLQEDPSDALSEFDDMMRRGAADGSLADALTDEDRARRRRRRRRGWIAAAVVFALILGSIGGYVGWALSRPLPAPTAVSEVPGVPAGTPAALAMPTRGAAAVSVAGADAYLGPDASGVWQLSGTEDPRPIASLSKLVTALVVLDRHPLAGPDDPGPTIRFTEADEDLYDEYYVLGATIAPLDAGSTMSLRDALATMLIPSASNYAEAVSTWAFGSQSAFVGAARRWLSDRGLSATSIVEPTGIDARNTSTPRDLLALAHLAAADPALAAIVATRSVTIAGPGTLVSTNGLLGDHGIDGLKTGNLGPGSHHLMYTATVDVGAAEPVRITGVILDGETRDSVGRDALSLIDSIDAGFHQVPVITAGREVGTYSTAWGSSATLVASDAASIFTWSDTPITVEMQLDPPREFRDGEVVGTLTWTAGPQTATTTLEVEGSIAPPDEWWRLTHPRELADG
jgi:serine-type D-Ala-D-Ala carboxypeptidase (penicillin-binding protein 5/6)